MRIIGTVLSTVKISKLEHLQNWMKLAHNYLFRVFLCRKTLFLHVKFNNNQNQLVYERFSGCSNLGSMFKVYLALRVLNYKKLSYLHVIK